MNEHEDSWATRSGNSILTVYLIAIVIGLLAATASPDLQGQATGSHALPTAKMSPQIASSRAVAQDDEPSDPANRQGSGALTDRADETSNAITDQGGDIAETSANSDNRPSLALARFDFDLGERSALTSSARPAGDGQIEVRKAVYSGGSQLGAVDITIDRNARLFVKGADLRKILGSKADGSTQAARIGPDGLVSFQRLRELGVSLRYDPIADHIVLQTD